MDHPLKGKWRSYLIGETVTPNPPPIDPDETDNVMDLTEMKETGHLDAGTHNQKKITGQATQVGTGVDATFFLFLDYEDGTRRYEGYLVRDKDFGGGEKRKLVAGRYIIRRLQLDKKPFAITDKGAMLLSQEEGTWIITQP